MDARYGSVTTRDPITVRDSFTATSVEGDVTVDFAAPPRTIDAVTSDGDVTLGLPQPGPYLITAQAGDPDDAMIAVERTSDPTLAVASVTARSSTGSVTGTEPRDLRLSRAGDVKANQYSANDPTHSTRCHVSHYQHRVQALAAASVFVDCSSPAKTQWGSSSLSATSAPGSVTRCGGASSSCCFASNARPRPSRDAARSGRVCGGYVPSTSAKSHTVIISRGKDSVTRPGRGCGNSTPVVSWY